MLKFFTYIAPPAVNRGTCNMIPEINVVSTLNSDCAFNTAPEARNAGHELLARWYLEGFFRHTNLSKDKKDELMKTKAMSSYSLIDTKTRAEDISTRPQDVDSERE